VAPTRQADLSPLPCLIGFATADPQPQAAGHDGDVLDLKKNQLGAAQCADEAEQQQGAVTPAAGTLITDGEKLTVRPLCGPAGRGCAAHPAAGLGYRDARGSTAGR
jgi:hypothetical protein